MIPVGWNSQREAGNTQQKPGLLKLYCKKNNSCKREASNNQHDLGVIDNKEMIPGGWNGQRKAGNTQQNPGLLKL